MYPNHPWNWLHFGHGLLIFFTLAAFWISETGLILDIQPFSWKCMGGMGWNLAYLCIMTRFWSWSFDFPQFCHDRSGVPCQSDWPWVAKRYHSYWIPRIYLFISILWYLETWKRQIRGDVIMGTMASQITSVTIVYSTVWTGAKKTSKLRVTGLCAGNSPVTGEFPAQMASYAENISIWWCHHFSIWKLLKCQAEAGYPWLLFSLCFLKYIWHRKD